MALVLAWQDAIKTTFTALHDIIRAQGRAIRSLEREVKSKVSEAEFDKALMHKANIVDINASLQDVSVALENKANVWDLESKIGRTEVRPFFILVRRRTFV